MTIQEAVKNGKPFRRATWGRRYPKDWYTTKGMYSWERSGTFIRRIGSENLYAFCFADLNERWLRDILATDWEVKK